jgi:hypothetical protein
MTSHLEVLSLGAGVQSSALLLMACRGELPGLDHAIFADSHAEPPEVYDWIEAVLRPEAERAGIGFHVVDAGDIAADMTNPDRPRQTAPFYVAKGGGKKGQLHRQCSERYKVLPVRRHVRSLLGLGERGPAPAGTTVSMWLGISTDEVYRVRDSNAGHITNRYPLIDAGMSRSDCQAWLRRNGFGEAPRSACYFCPYHTQGEWREMSPDLFAKAVAFDVAIRNLPLPDAEVFVHWSLKPLSDAIRQPDVEQLDLWGSECEGVCNT